jgi:hypothetical protein
MSLRTHIEAILLALALAVAASSCSSSRSSEASQQETEPFKTAAIKGDSTAVADPSRPDIGNPTEQSYVCTKGDFRSNEPTVCPTHKEELLRVGTYFCPTNDGYFNDHPGKCPKCGRELERVNE